MMHVREVLMNVSIYTLTPAKRFGKGRAKNYHVLKPTFFCRATILQHD
jgi:hypothetical protein